MTRPCNVSPSMVITPINFQAHERDESSTLSSNTQYTSTYISPSGSASRQADEIHEAAEKAKGWYM